MSETPDFDYLEKENTALRDERDALQAELKGKEARLKFECEQVDALKAEVAQLKTDFWEQAKVHNKNMDRDKWKALAGELAEAIKEALAPLGQGHCKANSCAGCECEVDLAVESLEEGLSKYDTVTKEAR